MNGHEIGDRIPGRVNVDIAVQAHALRAVCRRARDERWSLDEFIEMVDALGLADPDRLRDRAARLRRAAS